MSDPEWAGRVRAAREMSGVSVEDLWWRYFSLGGSLPLGAAVALFSRSQAVDFPDGDVLVHALNEIFAARGLDHPLPYDGDSTDSTDSSDSTGSGAGSGGRTTGGLPMVEHGRLLSRLGAVTARLIDAASHLEPDGLADLVSREARWAGLADAVVFLADYEQRVLTPLGLSGEPALDVEGTMAGRAFQTERPFSLGRGDGDWLIWLPLLDGTERLGVLELHSPFVSDELLRRARQMAGVVAEVVVSKSKYGDALVLARRRQPMTLTAELRWPVLPPLTFSSHRVGIACVLEPAYDVAGDAFDYAMNRGVLHFAIFDAMGHGLEATQMANLALSAYRYCRRRGTGLAETYTAIDEVLTLRFGTDRFVTAQLATLESATGTLRWLSAGHPYPLVLRRGRLASELTVEPSLPLGLGFFPESENEISLEPEDHLLFFTDGVVEAHSPGGERFGQDRLVDLAIRALADQQTLAETARRLVRSVSLHRDGPLEDDATLLFVKWDPSRS